MKINYIASPTFRRVHKSNALVKAIRGPIGSGKSVGCVMEMFRICLNQEPNSDGVRRTRPLDKVIKGIVYRGQKSVLRIDSNNFLCEGELFLFGSILAEFFRLYGTIN